MSRFLILRCAISKNSPENPVKICAAHTPLLPWPCCLDSKATISNFLLCKFSLCTFLLARVVQVRSAVPLIGPMSGNAKGNLGTSLPVNFGTPRGPSPQAPRRKAPGHPSPGHFAHDSSHKSKGVGFTHLSPNKLGQHPHNPTAMSVDSPITKLEQHSPQHCSTATCMKTSAQHDHHCICN